jgi:hypothetical protein
MTANDFFLLFVAFGGFLIAPALLLWGIVRLTQGRPGATRGPDSRPDKGSPDGSTGAGRTERPDEAPDFSRRIAARRGCPAMA